MVDCVAPEITRGASSPVALYHWYVNDPVPPAGVAVSVYDCPWSRVSGVGAIDTVGAASTVTVSAADIALAGGSAGGVVVPVSRTCTVMLWAPAAVEGVVANVHVSAVSDVHPVIADAPSNHEYS